MSKLIFHGNLDGISETQFDFIRSVLENRGYKNETVQVLAVGKADDNIVANVKRFVIEKDGKTFKMIGKIAPGNEMFRQNLNTKLLFYNEHVMYTEVLPKFTEIVTAAGIPEDERLQYAECYGSYTEAPNEIILLEDLQLSDLVMLDKTKSLKDDTMKLVLKNFALLHSYSFVLKNQEPEKFVEWKKKLVSNWSLNTDNAEFKTHLHQIENEVISILDNEKYTRFVKGSLVNLSQNHLKNLEHNQPKSTVIIQGDPWTNNVMFKLEGGVAIQCCMIDYQVSSENSPALDLEYLIFNCTDYEMRSKNYNQWIDFYYQELDKSLSKFGLSVKEIYPRKQLDAELKRFGKQCLGISLLMATMLMRETTDAEGLKDALANDDMNEMMEMCTLKNMGKSSLVWFSDRVQGLIKSFLELGYFEDNQNTRK